MIGTDGNLVLELWRHQNAMVDYHDNPIIQNPMHQILFSMNHVSNLLAHPDEVEEEEEENDDDGENDDDEEDQENNDDDEEDQED